MEQSRQRCGWVNQDPLYMAYHDEEWGRPLRDNQKLFELLMLEGMQAGLSWYTVLKKREHYREVFDHFDPTKIAAYDETKVEQLLQDPGIIRNKLKVRAIIHNAGMYQQIEREEGSFANYMWGFVDDEPIINQWTSRSEVPTNTPISDTMSKVLKKRGFKFVGTTICYAFMQASGMVNDHTLDCFCRTEQTEFKM